MNILIVDDNKNYTNQLKKYLMTKKFDVDVKISVKSAINSLKTTQYDVILLDLIVGEKSGIELMEWANENNIQSHFLILTGYPSIDSAVKTMKLGALEYLQKPFDLNRLLSILENIETKLHTKHSTYNFMNYEPIEKLKKPNDNKNLIIIDFKPDKIAEQFRKNSTKKIKLDRFTNLIDITILLKSYIKKDNVVVLHGGFQELFNTKDIDDLANYFQKISRMSSDLQLILLHGSDSEKKIIDVLFNLQNMPSFLSLVQLLGNEIRQMILGFLIIYKKLQYTEFLHMLNISNSSKAAFHLRKLQTAGLIEKKGKFYLLTSYGYECTSLLHSLSNVFNEKFYNICLINQSFL